MMCPFQINKSSFRLLRHFEKHSRTNVKWSIILIFKAVKAVSASLVEHNRTWKTPKKLLGLKAVVREMKLNALLNVCDGL